MYAAVSCDPHVHKGFSIKCFMYENVVSFVIIALVRIISMERIVSVEG